MTIATPRIDTDLLRPFLQLHHPEDADHAAVAEFIIDQRPDARSRQNLINWHHAHQKLEVQTEVCTNCWAISVTPPGSLTQEPVRLNACEGCQRVICDLCYQHQPGPWREKCQCRDCADQTPTVPEQYQDAAPALLEYLRFTLSNGLPHLRAATIAMFLAINPQHHQHSDVMQQWRRQAAQGHLHTLHCPRCRLLAISHDPDHSQHGHSQDCRSPTT